jgi:hypothetical protein
MSDAMGWSRANQRMLVRELDRMRLRLERHLAADLVAPEPTVDIGPSYETAPTPVSSDSSDESGPYTPALETLVQLFGLSAFERDIVLLCAGVELDTALAVLVAQAHGDGARSMPTFALALALLEGAHWSALSPDGPLRAWRLIQVVGPSLTSASLRIDERVLHFLAGVEHLDERLHGLVEVRARPDTSALQSSELAAVVFDRLSGASPGRHQPPCVQVIGADSAARRTFGDVIAAGLRTVALCMRGADVPAAAAERAALATLVTREAKLRSALVFLDVAADADESRIVSFVAGLTVATLVTSAEAVRGLGTDVPQFELLPLTSAERLDTWHNALGQRARQMNGALTRVTAQFELDRTSIESVAAAVLASDGAPDDDAALVWDRCRAATRPRMEGLAHRIEAIAGWDDLVLPEAQLQVMRTIASHVRMRHRVYEEWGFAEKSARGLGIAALFAGASGTGKTMAAEVLARELRLDLYRIDLASMVSKYIGETEKNLKRLFDTAEGSGAILLFDEADALFGKRSEVKDSHDRYANLETSYLLQRMESYRGLSILTTNMRSALDSAFLRRIRFIVNFPFPAAEQRAAIWRGAFPARVPMDTLAWERLAQLNVAGGQIRNIALSAAFLAADRSQAVGMQHLVEAVHAEYAKAERTPSDAELRGWL